ncbi:MAG TPA: MarR family winged helix-turn-helix transcriptional regulator [candidate division Zixibacteria bacterium]|nr:MarR family winged helix-turn-helix transcriptional regulator [candidate division Zixibacteria bacterium]
MKKIFLKLSILFLMVLFQISFIYCALEDNAKTETPQEIFLRAPGIYQQTNGLEIISPRNGEVITGSTTILWTFSYPYYYAESISSVFYSSDLGLNWILLGFDSIDNSFEWNTILYEEFGSNFKIKIIASSKEWSTDLEAISEGFFTINNREETPNVFPWYLYIIIPLLIISVGSITGLFLNRSRLQKRFSFNFLKTDQTDKIKTLSHKVIIGLEKIKDNSNWSPEISLPSGAAVSLENGSIVQSFPSSFQNELKSEIRGRTVMVLIEIAYQNPSETNPVKIAEGVGIPLSTLSKEIKKLITLNYIESHISNQVLFDARYRNFKITAKGFEFLSILNIILKNTINQIQNREGIISS